MSRRLDRPPAPAPTARRFQILALSGGGVRGLYSACVLEALEARAGRALYACFDLLAGTSIGGIIAMGLALGRDAAAIRDIVERAGPRLFPPRSPWRRPFHGLLRARYPAGALRAVVEEVVGVQARLGDLKRALLVPAVALTSGSAQAFRSPHHPAHAPQADTRLIEVALATAAAPSLFPVARVGPVEYVDGGLIANAPDALALHEAQIFFNRRREDVFMLSVGTTTDLAALAAGGEPSRGLLYWMGRGRLAEVVMSAQQELSLQMAREALGRRHLAINSVRSAEQSAVVALDRADAAAQATLKAMARHACDRVAADPRLHQFLNHQGRPLDRAGAPAVARD